jgi:hypothetical protein
MNIKSNKVSVNGTISEIKSFLMAPHNYLKLLPKDKISDFKFDDISCSFKVQGGVLISLVIVGNTENQIVLKSGDKSPFPFDLFINLSKEEEKVEGFIEFNGEVNMFLKMMVEKPLMTLFNYMSIKLEENFDK